MWENIYEFLRKETHKTRDVMPPAFGIGIAIGFIALILFILLIISGIVFAIISIVKVSKKKKKARLEAEALENAKTTEEPETE